MKILHAILITFVAAMMLTACNKSTTANPNAPTPASNQEVLKQAVQKFNISEGHYPKTLDELVPKYLDKIPDAPGGYKFAYTAATGEIRLSR